MRGRRCPKALASLESERVCPKVCVNRNKSQSCSSREEGWKRGWNAQNPLCFSQGAFREAPEPSGALITASFALKHGREVFAVPGSILSSRSMGVNKLIQDGARPVMDVNDILEALNLFLIPQQIEMQAALAENAEERTLLELISHDPRHVDDLIRESGLPTTTVTATLMMMELKGMVKQVGGMQYDF